MGGPKDADKAGKGKEGKGKGKEEEPEMSEEDMQLKEELDLLATRAGDADAGVQKAALEAIADKIKESIGTMTNIPKPLKFLKDHYAPMKGVYENMQNPNKELMADVLSVMAMTMAEEGSDDSLRFRLEASRNIATWGHEYVRSLCGGVVGEWTRLVEASETPDHLLPLVNEIVAYHIAHSAESEAVDLLLEVERLDDVFEHVNEQNWNRIVQYLLSCAQYFPPDEADEVRRACLTILRNAKQPAAALRVAMMLNDRDLITEIFDACDDADTKKQMALMLGSQQVFLDVDDEDLLPLVNNSKLSEHFLALGRELDVLEPKLPADIFRTSGNTPGMQAESARANLATTLVNAFVNAGFCNDKLMNVRESGTDSAWIFKNKEHGMLSAVASTGMIMMWDVDNALTHIDRYMYSENKNITAGALLGCGIVNAGVRHDCDPALALLSEHVTSKSDIISTCAMLGLGIAYAGSSQDEVVECILEAITDANASVEVVCIGALSLGLACTASCNADVAESLLQCLMERSAADLKNPLINFLCLGLGLLYLGKGAEAELTIEACRALDESIAEFCTVIVEFCAGAGSGDVLRIQKLLEVAGRHPPEEPAKEDDKEDKEKAEKPVDPLFARLVSVAVVGIGVVAMGEDIGVQMATRMISHLIQFGDPAAKRAIPLCLAMLSPSNAEYKVEVTETLQKLSHDPDSETSMSAILGLGIVGAGTNNSRIADTLRQLAGYYESDPNHMFVVRLSQGLLHMGKGLLSISPFHSDRALLRPTALASLIVVAFAGLDFKNILLQKYQYLMFTLSLAMHPRMLVFVDHEMNPVSLTVRVGQAVDTVGQAGNPKRITAFQTHSTPVLLHQNERAELADDEYEPCSSVLEGFVLVKRKP